MNVATLILQLQTMAIPDDEVTLIVEEAECHRACRQGYRVTAAAVLDYAGVKYE